MYQYIIKLVCYDVKTTAPVTLTLLVNTSIFCVI